jgi:hypothetical protein
MICNSGCTEKAIRLVGAIKGDGHTKMEGELQAGRSRVCALNGTGAPPPGVTLKLCVVAIKVLNIVVGYLYTMRLGDYYDEGLKSEYRLEVGYQMGNFFLTYTE